MASRDLSVPEKLAFITLPVILLLAIAGELACRFVVQAAESPSAVFDDTFKIIKFDVNGQRTGVFTTGPLAEGHGRWRINDDGWNSDIEYDHQRPRSRPLIVIIGDSFVEARQVDVDKNIAGVLRQSSNGRADVYSFGVSGAPLSSYLQMSRYVRKVFDPDVIVVNVVYNDFDESVRALKKKTEFLQFSTDASGVHEIEPVPYVPVHWRRFLRRSALARYLMLNAKLNELPARLITSVRGITTAERLERGRPSIEPVIARIVSDLRQENPRAHIIFLLDEPRREIRESPDSEKRLAWIPAMMRRLADANRCSLVDLTSVLRSFRARTNQPVNYRHDFHWNENGHRLAAGALLQELRAERIVP